MSHVEVEVEVEVEGKSFLVPPDGYIPLESFSMKLLDLSPEDLGAFFDPSYRFYNKYGYIRQGLRHNVQFCTIQKKNHLISACKGGIYHEDLHEFIHRARMAIVNNDKAFDDALKQSGISTRTCTIRNRLSLFVAKSLRKLSDRCRKLSKSGPT